MRTNNLKAARPENAGIEVSQSFGFLDGELDFSAARADIDKTAHSASAFLSKFRRPRADAMNRFHVFCFLIVCSILSRCELIRGADPPGNVEDTAIHVPTPHHVVAKMLKVAKVKKDDVLYDLGCGDGRIVVAAASKYGCRAVGYDIDARKVRQSRESVKAHGVERLARIERRDIFQLDLRKATVITLYLLPEMNEQLIPQLQKLKDGSRIVSHEFALEGIQYDRLITIKSAEDDGVPRDIYLYTLPLKRVLAEAKTGGVPPL